MKKRLLMIAFVLVLALALSACGCKHETWNDADCVNPKTCAECGETEGAPLSHTWQAATCEAPKTCEVCAATEGEALGHSWNEATCEAPKTCATCKLTEGEALGHDWQEATTETPKTCAICAQTEGEPIKIDSRFSSEATAGIQGSWAYEIDMTGEMMGLVDFEGALPCVMILDFGNDGSVDIRFAAADDDQFDKIMTEYLIASTYAELKESGMSKKEADAAMMENYGMDVEAYVEEIIKIAGFDDIFDSMKLSMVYYVEGDQLYLDLDWYDEMSSAKFLLEGDTLTLDDDFAGSGAEQTVFTRVTE